MFPFSFEAFVDYFSRGLHAEYKSKGIIVQVSSLFVWAWLPQKQWCLGNKKESAYSLIH